MLTRSQTKALVHFNRSVKIIRGDIGTLQDVDGTPVDALGFPTHSHLTFNNIGAAAAIFRRAGPELNTYVTSAWARGNHPTGDVVVTPSFKAGVSKLIHCVGPRNTQYQCYELLEKTYENLMNAIVRENVKCVAIASISTGNMGVPAKEAAQVAMRVIEKFIRRTHWDGLLAIVCYEDAVFEAFTREKLAVLGSSVAQL
ncbi:Macro domain-containing protein, partial [Globisporangium splendens]